MKTNVLYEYFEFIWKIFAWCFGIIGIANTISYSKEGSWQYWLLVLLCYFMFFGGLFLITDFPLLMINFYKKFIIKLWKRAQK
jgi:hypothetical protein